MHASGDMKNDEVCLLKIASPVSDRSLQDADTIKKKRGRKPSGKIIDLNKVNIGNAEFSDCIIAHLPLNQKDIAKINNNKDRLLTHVFGNNVIEHNNKEVPPSLSININDDVVCHHCVRCEELQEKLRTLQDRLQQKESESNKEEAFQVVHCTNGKVVKKVEPKEGESVCWWCCHKFNSIPIGLPEKYDKGEFQLYGHFCSFNCAHAYNVHQNDFKIWERYSLLHLYHKKVFPQSSILGSTRIMPAPPRQALQMFGGELTIEQFRHQNLSIAKEYRYMLPPYVSANGMIEEIHKTVNKLPASTNLKLKRNKPLPGINNNLLQLMKKT